MAEPVEQELLLVNVNLNLQVKVTYLLYHHHKVLMVDKNNISLVAEAEATGAIDERRRRT